ncbi:hypothetical protein HDU93_005246 [Gonapodya sp. JEL0774]|nr:hypothetical protein HDU93_005246 [Gonapodya sp. JEL0774]
MAGAITSATSAIPFSDTSSRRSSIGQYAPSGNKPVTAVPASTGSNTQTGVLPPRHFAARPPIRPHGSNPATIQYPLTAPSPFPPHFNPFFPRPAPHLYGPPPPPAVAAHLKNLEAFSAQARQQILTWGERANWRIDLVFLPPGDKPGPSTTAATIAGGVGQSLEVSSLSGGAPTGNESHSSIIKEGQSSSTPVGATSGRPITAEMSVVASDALLSNSEQGGSKDRETLESISETLEKEESGEGFDSTDKDGPSTGEGRGSVAGENDEPDLMELFGGEGWATGLEDEAMDFGRDVNDVPSATKEPDKEQTNVVVDNNSSDKKLDNACTDTEKPTESPGAGMEGASGPGMESEVDESSPPKLVSVASALSLLASPAFLTQLNPQIREKCKALADDISEAMTSGTVAADSRAVSGTKVVEAEVESGVTQDESPETKIAEVDEGNETAVTQARVADTSVSDCAIDRESESQPNLETVEAVEKTMPPQNEGLNTSSIEADLTVNVLESELVDGDDENPVAIAKKELEVEYREKFEKEVESLRRRSQLALDEYTRDKFDHVRRVAELQDMLATFGVVPHPPPANGAPALVENASIVNSTQVDLSPLELLGRIAEEELVRRDAVSSAVDTRIARASITIAPPRPVIDISVGGSYVAGYEPPRRTSPPEPARRSKRRRYYYTSGESEDTDDDRAGGRGLSGNRVWSASETGSSEGEEGGERSWELRGMNSTAGGTRRRRWGAPLAEGGTHKSGWMHRRNREPSDSEDEVRSGRGGRSEVARTNRRRPLVTAVEINVKGRRIITTSARAAAAGTGRRREESDEDEDEDGEEEDDRDKASASAKREVRLIPRRTVSRKNAARKDAAGISDDDDEGEALEEDGDDVGHSLQGDDDSEETERPTTRSRRRAQPLETSGVKEKGEVWQDNKLIPKLPRNSIIVPSHVGVPAVGKPVPAGTMAQLTRGVQSAGSVVIGPSIHPATVGRVKVVHPPAQTGQSPVQSASSVAIRPITSGQLLPRPFMPGLSPTTIQRRPARKPVDISNIPVTGVTVRKLKDSILSLNATANAYGKLSSHADAVKILEDDTMAANEPPTSTSVSVSAPESASASPRRKIKLMVRPPSRPGSPDRSRAISRGDSAPESRVNSPDRVAPIVAGSLTPLHRPSNTESGLTTPKGTLFKSFSPKELVNEVNKKLQADIAKGIYIGRTNLPPFQQPIPVRPLVIGGTVVGPSGQQANGHGTMPSGSPAYVGNYNHGNYFRPALPGTLGQLPPGSQGLNSGMQPEMDEKWRIAFAQLPPGTLEKNPALARFSGPFSSASVFPNTMAFAASTSVTGTTTIGLPTTIGGIPGVMAPASTFHSVGVRPRPTGTSPVLGRSLPVSGEERRVTGLAGSGSPIPVTGVSAGGGHGGNTSASKNDGSIASGRKETDDRIHTGGMKRKLDSEDRPSSVKRPKEISAPGRAEISSNTQDVDGAVLPNGINPGVSSSSAPATAGVIGTHAPIPVPISTSGIFRPMPFTMPGGQTFNGISVPLQQGGHLIFPMASGPSVTLGTSTTIPEAQLPSTMPLTTSSSIPLVDGSGGTRPPQQLPQIKSRVGRKPSKLKDTRDLSQIPASGWPMPVIGPPPKLGSFTTSSTDVGAQSSAGATIPTHSNGESVAGLLGAFAPSGSETVGEVAHLIGQNVGTSSENGHHTNEPADILHKVANFLLSTWFVAGKMFARSAGSWASLARAQAVLAPGRFVRPVIGSRGFASSTPKRAEEADFVQSIYVNALRSYKPAPTTETVDLPETFSKPAVPAVPSLEAAPASSGEETGEIVLVREEDFPPYKDPAEDPEDFDLWWDYTLDHEYPPYSYNRPHKPPTELHE